MADQLQPLSQVIRSLERDRDAHSPEQPPDDRILELAKHIQRLERSVIILSAAVAAQLPDE